MKTCKLLPEICKIQYGYPFDSSLFSESGNFPLIRIRDVRRGYTETYTSECCSQEYIVNYGDILIGMDGEFNIAKWSSTQAYLNQRVCKLIPHSCIDKGYLFFFMPKALKEIEARTPFATVKHLSAKELNRITVPFPKLEEQQRISFVLQSVVNIIELQKTQLQKIDQLAKSRFIEMFGDPVENPKKWATCSLSTLGTFKNGMNFSSNERGIEIHCLGVGDFKNLSIINTPTKLPIISLALTPSAEYLLQDGDIIFVRSNGNKALVGRCVAIYTHGLPVTFGGFCIRFRVGSDAVNIMYLLRVLKADTIRKKMAGRGANIQNLNQKMLARLAIPIPPIALQNEFAAFIEQLDKSKFTIRKSLEKLETLYRALLQEYFG